MSKSKFKVQKGLNFIATTGEPVWVSGFGTRPTVDEQNETIAYITRGVVRPNGIDHVDEEFPYEQLETIYKRAEREVEIQEFVQTLREDAQNKRYTLPANMKEVLEQAKAKHQALNPSSQRELSFEGFDGK